MFLAIKKEFAGFTATERLFVLCAMLVSFCICGDYALIRPVCNSVFIHTYGAKAFPYAWLATIPINFVLVALYNRLLSKFTCLKIWFGTVSLIMLGEVAGGLFLKHNTLFSFFYYIWKDIYILFLFQQLWSVIHSTISSDRAKYLYGLIFAVGALGSIAGSLIPGFLAVKVGSEALLFYALPFCLGLLLFYAKALKFSSISTTMPPSQSKGFFEGIRQIKGSKILTLILLLVIFMQCASTLLDYQFNLCLESSIATKDLRTEFTGRVFGFAHLITLGMQIGGTFLFLSFLGLRRTHYFVPLLLGGNALCSLFLPVFGFVTYSFMTIKSLDFSLYSIIKEMLYIPLKKEEKFHAKSIVDVFAYRSSKALASGFILLLQGLAFSHLIRSLSWMLIGIFTFWLLSLFFLYREDYSLQGFPKGSIF